MAAISGDVAFIAEVGDIVNQPLEVLDNEDKNIDMPKIKGSIKLQKLDFLFF